MATVQRPEERYVEFDEYIDFQLDKARNGIKWTDILAAAAGVGTLLVGYLVLFVVADHWLFRDGVPIALRQVSLGVVGLVALGWIGWKCVWPYVRRVNDLYAAQMLERAEPSLRGSLFGLVDSRRAGRPPTEEVRRSLERRAATTLSNVDVESALDRRMLMRMSYVLLAVVLAACVYAIASPKRIGPSLLRALLPSSAIGVATRTEILDVQPGHATVLAGEELPVSIMIRGEAPEKVLLYYSTEDQRFVDEPIEMRLTDETTREYQAVLIGDAGRGLSQDLTYRIEANDDAAGPFSIDVDQPPAATVTSIAFQYPAYTGLEPAQRETPQIEAIEGTNVALTASANRPLRSAKLVFADDDRFLSRGEEVPLRVSKDGLTLTASWKLAIRSDNSSPTFYRIECRDQAGKTNPKPAVYPIAIHADQPPDITLHDPKSDLERPANAVIPLLVTARDPDFRLRELTLRIEKRGQELPDRTVLWEGSDAEAAVRHDWDLGPLALKLGDVVSFYVQARDNREPEFNRRNSPKLNVIITEPVAQEEVQRQLEEEKQRQEQELAESEQNAAGAESEEQQPEDAGEEQNAEGESAESVTEAGEKEGDASQNAEEQGGANEAGREEGPSGSKAGTRESSVKNDGSQDDEVLRKLLDRQREQQKSKDEQQPKGDEPQADSAGEPKNGQNGGDQQAPKQEGNENSQQKPKEANSKNDDTAEEKGNGASGSEGDDSSPPNEGGASKESDSTDPAGKDGNAKDGPDPSNAAQDSTTGDGDQSGDDASENSAAEKSAKAGSEGTTKDTEAASGDAASSASDEDGMSGQADGQGQPAAKQTEKQDAAQNASSGEPSGDSAEESNEPSTSSTDEGDSDLSNAKPSTAGSKEQPPGAADPNPGEGRPDQKSQRPDSGEQGSGEPNVDGTPDGEQGAGDAGTRPGSQRPSDSATGQSGGKATEKGQPGEGKSDNAAESGRPAENGAAPQNSRKADQTKGQQTPPSNTTNQSEKDATAGEKDTAKPSEKTSGEPQNQSEGSESGTSDSGEGQSGEGKSGEGKSGEGKSGEGKSGEGKSGEGKSGEGKSGEGKSGEGKSGEGESGEGESGEGKSGEGKSGEGKSGEGKSGEGKSGEGKSGEGKSGEGKSGQQGAAGQGGQAGKGGGRPGAKGGQGSGSSSSNGPSEGGTAESEGAGSGTDAANTAEAANADYTKQATDLALKKLEDDLQRGDVDPELLNDLGWTEADMRRFADRLRKNLEAPTGEESPQDLAQRKEFEHMLENLSIEKGPAAREASGDRVRNVEGVGTKNPEIPSAYRSAYEAFTRSVAGRRTTTDKPK